jgi:hypothetical protein
VFKPDSSCSACNSLRVVKILHPAIKEHEKINKLENKRLYGKVDYEESKDSVDDCEGTDEKCTEQKKDIIQNTKSSCLVRYFDNKTLRKSRSIK